VVQVVRIKHTLKGPGTKRLKAKYDKLLSLWPQVCCQFQLVPYSGVPKLIVAFDVDADGILNVTASDSATAGRGSPLGRCVQNCTCNNKTKMGLIMTKKVKL
jgi:hypothetical protein